MSGTFTNISIKKLFSRVAVLLSALFYLLTVPPEAFSQPALLDAGMNPNQVAWSFDRNVSGADKEVKFWMRVQRQGNLSRFGTFDYYFKIQVLRPDGSEVWNTVYGFDEQGYSEQKFMFPIFFYERSMNKLSPSFGTWKVKTSVVEKDSNREVTVKEYAITFSDAKKQTTLPLMGQSGREGKPFPVPPFQYQKWSLKDWGIGIYDEVSTGPNTYDKEIIARDSRNAFPVKEAMDAWAQGHKFAALLAGPPVQTYVDSNNRPLYLFGYILKRPGGENDGQNPQYRTSQYCNNPGSLIFPFDLRKPGRYRIDFLLRERDSNSWEEKSWVPIGGIDFTLTE